MKFIGIDLNIFLEKNKMANYGHVGFLRKEEGLMRVDPEIRELVRAMNQIPYFATYGVSCAGHFLEDVDMPSGGLGFIAIPGKRHVADLI